MKVWLSEETVSAFVVLVCSECHNVILSLPHVSYSQYKALVSLLYPSYYSSCDHTRLPSPLLLSSYSTSELRLWHWLGSGAHVGVYISKILWRMNSSQTPILPIVIFIIIPTRQIITRSRHSHFLPAEVECGIAVNSLPCWWIWGCGSFE